MIVSLHTSTLAAHAHEAVVLPWLREAAKRAPRSLRAVAVLVPLRADGYFLKARALEAGIDLFGVHFLTPSDVRDRLAGHLGRKFRVPLREHSRLLLATAAERRDEAGVAASPDQLLKAVDFIGGSGWDFAEAGPPRLRGVVAEFQKLLKKAGFSMMHDADHALLAAAPGKEPHFASLLVTGFNAAHWPFWPLLEATVRCAERTDVCLTDPRMEAEDLDAAWVGTWEQAFGAANPVAIDPPPSPMAELVRPLGVASNGASADVDFLVGEDTAEQARAMVTRALQYLAEPSCERLGILFPSAGALSRRVAALLAERDVPHYDGLPHSAPGRLEDAAWPAWLALQENPRLPALLSFLEARPRETFAGMDVVRAAEELRRVFQELLLDDLLVMAEYLADSSRRDSWPALAEGLKAMPFLPRRGTIAEFVEKTAAMMRDLGWKEREQELERLAEDWKEAEALEISRRSWLRWLGETLVSWKTTRAEAGRHPYSRLHLLPYGHAESQAWTHLIAAGLNEGEWPPRFEDAGFLGEEETEALNRRLWAINTKTATQGRQGEGHVIVQTGKAFCLGPLQLRALAARRFFNTLESATTAVTLSAQLHDEAAPERPLNPGEFFFQLYFAARGRALGHDTMIELRVKTAEWLEASGQWTPAVPDAGAAQQTRQAYEVRRATGVPFGEFEFALVRPPQPPLRMAAKRWEDAFGSPAQAWLGAVLDVYPAAEDEETPWALAHGNWVHDWLRAIAGGAPSQEFFPLPSPQEFQTRVRGAAQKFRDRVAAALSRHEQAVPDWWTSAWEQALQAASALAASVAQIAGRTHAAVEWKLDRIPVPIGESALHVHGRIDLLLSTAASIEDTLLVDYKSGQRKALNVSSLVAGDGLQLALYALALRAAGAKSVGLSLLTPGAELAGAQLTVETLDTLEGTWRGLVRMQDHGVFGGFGPLRSEFGHGSPYPLATLAIDAEIVAEKRALTHPELAAREDEE